MTVKYFVLFVLTCLLTQSATANSNVRTVVVKRDQVVSVRTALGIATLIQIPDRPTSAIIGDLESFKLEYLDGGVAIKPVLPGARTNLYIYTEGRRFNVHLLPVSKEAADYIVYLKPESNGPPKEASQIRWKPYRTSGTKGTLTLTIKRIGHAGPGYLLADFEVESTKPIEIKPEWFWVSQKNKTKVIQNLYLSSLIAKPFSPVAGTLTLKYQDLDVALTPSFELRGPEKISLKLPEVNRWLK